jgi:hypothetical protein
MTSSDALVDIVLSHNPQPIAQDAREVRTEVKFVFILDLPILSVCSSFKTVKDGHEQQACCDASCQAAVHGVRARVGEAVGKPKGICQKRKLKWFACKSMDSWG